MINILNSVIEIEDYNGNTVLIFEIDDVGKIIRSDNMSVADIDNDYIYNSGKKLIRIQKESEEK